MKPKRIKWLAAFVLLIGFIVFKSKSLELTAEDNSYLRAFSKEWKLYPRAAGASQSFDAEIELIRAIQDSVIYHIVHREIPHLYFGDVGYYYRQRIGFCYDRAALIEKLLAFHGFSYRHAFVYFGHGRKTPSPADFFSRKTLTHALLEVKTQKGWMVMGTNANWIGLSTKGEVLSLSAIRNSVANETLVLKYPATAGTIFWTEKGRHFRYVYGVYSRHGDFFNRNRRTKLASLISFSFIPDYNLPMLFYNL